MPTGDLTMRLEASLFVQMCVDIGEILISILLGSFRIAGFKSQAFQAIAHIFVGFLLARWLDMREPLHLILLIGLTVLEVACFLYFKRHG
jgi:hypothetical protein